MLMIIWLDYYHSANKQKYRIMAMHTQPNPFATSNIKPLNLLAKGLR